jgi:hypothetical protein
MSLAGLVSDLTLRPVNDLAVGLLRFERRTEFLWRDLFDRLLAPPALALVEALMSAGLRDGELAIAQERTLPEEKQLAREIEREIAAFLRANWMPGGVPRFGNSKTYGVVRGELTVLPDLPRDLRHGVFARPATYRAWVRFSGPGPYAPPDLDDFGQCSVAIKLLGVPGSKLIDDEHSTQDFILANPPACVTADARDNLKLQRRVRAGIPLFFALDPLDPHLLSAALQLLHTRVHSSPLEVRYHSQTPYLLGEGQAVQYVMRPCSAARTGIPARPSPNYLREAMAAALADSDWSFDFMVQRQVDARRMPIEDASIPWSERRSPPVPVATLRLPAQHFDSDEQIAFADGLRFNPWHALPAHRPLGSSNRARGRVYREMARLRQQMNGVPHVEPTGDETFPEGSPGRSVNGRRRPRERAGGAGAPRAARADD